MNNAVTQKESIELSQVVTQACNKIAPLWPLSHFVAVNPFVGFADQNFAHTIASQKRIRGADMLMPLNAYRKKFKEGAIDIEDLRRMVEQASDEVRESFKAAQQPLTFENVIKLLDEARESDVPTLQPGPFSAFLDGRETTHWQHFIREEIAKWCAAYFDHGQSLWKFPKGSKTFYQAWKEVAMVDRNPQLSGLKHFCQMVRSVPDEPLEAIAAALKELEIPEHQTDEFLYQVLLIVPGWAGHLRYRDREQELRAEASDLLAQFLAIIINYEVILYHHFENDADRILGWKRTLMEDPMDTGEPLLSFDLAQRLLWQNAFEHSLAQTIKANISPTPTLPYEEPARPDVQAAFCIDVRSEIFRRSLEATSPRIQTIGFAGFFGIAIDHQHPGQEVSQARCPVLLAPQVQTREHSHSGCCSNHGEDKRRNLRGWKQFREAAASSFSFVETLGLSYAYKLFKDAMGKQQKRSVQDTDAPTVLSNLTVQQRVDAAAGILKGLQLTKNFARLVLLCGHGSETKNNPYGSGLDCGACGGHAGDANARVAVTLLNDSEVRSGLLSKGIVIPGDTHFVAGLHNTTTDEVTLYDLAQIPRDLLPKVFNLQTALHEAGKKTALERGAHLKAQGMPADDIATIRNRSADWSQVRPEWGLAGNTAFIVAPRSATANANLQGRAFLHEYDAKQDPEGAILEAILGGPLVVGSWINLQYYGSAVDNAHFGSGHKSIHNVVGGIGVALGNENDLRPGLPFQSVHDGEKLMHEPTRLLACIAAEPVIIDKILSRNAHLSDLVNNGWIHLVALGAASDRWKRRLPNAQWQEARAPQSLPIVQ